MRFSVVVNGGTYSASTTCASGTGAYTLSNVTYTGDPRVIVYLDKTNQQKPRYGEVWLVSGEPPH